jgi:hypothetical protein
MTGQGASNAFAAIQAQEAHMTQRTSIENAYYDHDHDLFVSELAKLLNDKARLDYLESQRLKAQKRGGGPFGWDAFHYRTASSAGTVRDQIDAERS